MKKLTVQTSTTFATVFAALLCLGYLCIFAWAYPDKQFIGAMLFEVAAFAGAVLWRKRRARTESAAAQSLVLGELSAANPVLGIAHSAYKILALVFWLLVCLIFSFDLLALSQTSLESFASAKAIYKNCPIWMCLGMHPGGSAEVLAGADIKAEKFERAEKIMVMIKDLREQIYGANDEMTVAIYADFGDLYLKMKKYGQCDLWYSKAIALSKKIGGKTGYGRPLTGLANSKREQGKFSAATPLYEEALSMRQHLYGGKSEKVADTLEQFARLKDLQGDSFSGNQMRWRAHSIEAKRHEEFDPLTTAIMLVFSWIAGSFILGPKGVLTGMAVKKLSARIKAAESPAPADVSRLQALQAYQSKPAFLLNLAYRDKQTVSKN